MKRAAQEPAQHGGPDDQWDLTCLVDDHDLPPAGVLVEAVVHGATDCARHSYVLRSHVRVGSCYDPLAFFLHQALRCLFGGEGLAGAAIPTEEHALAILYQAEDLVCLVKLVPRPLVRRDGKRLGDGRLRCAHRLGLRAPQPENRAAVKCRSCSAANFSFSRCERPNNATVPR